MGWADYLSDLELPDIYNMPLWALKSTMPYDKEGNLHYGINDPVVGKWAAEQLPYAGMGMGYANIAGPVGGNRLVRAFHDKTGELLGELGYKDFPGIGAIIQNFRSKTPQATSEMYGAFNQEMGPLLDKVKVQGNIRPEAWQSVKGALDKGIYDETPNLAQQWRRALEESRGRYPDAEDMSPMRWR
jgi:hypothetical protein